MVSTLESAGFLAKVNEPRDTVRGAHCLFSSRGCDTDAAAVAVSVLLQLRLQLQLQLHIIVFNLDFFWCGRRGLNDDDVSLFGTCKL